MLAQLPIFSRLGLDSHSYLRDLIFMVSALFVCLFVIREEYVEVYIDYYLNKSVKKQFEAFSIGFHRVCGGKVLVSTWYNKLLPAAFYFTVNTNNNGFGLRSLIDMSLSAVDIQRTLL